MSGRALLAALGLSLWLAVDLARAAPGVSPPVFADVTPRSFAVVWIADESATATVRVFADAAATTDITATLRIVSESAGFPPAEANGVARVRVEGLAPNTTVYVQTETTSVATSEVTTFPAAPPLLAVMTADALQRVGGLGQTLINDSLAIEVRAQGGVGTAPGTLLLVGVQGGAHPISAFTGEGGAALFGLADLNRLFAAADGRSLSLDGEEALSFSAIGGLAGATSSGFRVPTPSGVGAIVVPDLPVVALEDQTGPDRDGDGLTDAKDNCPEEPNLDQLDRGGPGSGGTEGGVGDGTGDACQCGDTTDDGDPGQPDVDEIRTALADPAQGLAAPEKCNVVGATDPSDVDGDGLPDDCNVADVVVLRRALAGLEPQPQPVCAPAVP